MRNRKIGLGLGVLVAAQVGGARVSGGVVVDQAGGPSQVDTGGLAADQVPSTSCLATTLCAVKQRIRWRTPPWTMDYCQRLADTVLKAAARENLPPALIVGVMINESSLDERATRVTIKNGTVYAKDGGLMGIRCILDRQGRCTNGQTRGLSWNEVMNPTTNIALGAHALAYWRDVGGVAREPVPERGGVETRYRSRRCPHKDHAYWAHYNHGVRYIDHGPARFYPHRIAVLYYALARTMSVDTGNLTSIRLSAQDRGLKPRRADHPVGPRSLALFQTILNVGPVCGEFMTAKAAPAAAPAGPRCLPAPATVSSSESRAPTPTGPAGSAGPST